MTRNQRKQRWRTIYHLSIILLALFIVAVVACKVHLSGGEGKDASPVERAPEAQEMAIEEDRPEYHREAIRFYPIAMDQDLQVHIIRTCEEYEIDSAVVMAMIYRESSYRVDCIGDNGDSEGLMQVQEKWHKERMERLGVFDLLNPYQNTTVGIDFLSELLERYDGDIEKAVTAYNAGHYNGTVTEYAKAVMETAAELRSE